MLNYYEILGLTSKANTLEIKTAFRQLAKLYHPDKNPNGKEHFSALLKAYETLINPDKKLKYDHKLNYEQSVNQTGKAHAAKKYPNYDEREYKRRKYYEEHIKKYEKKNTQTFTEPEIKESYNEFKYILYATPLAVILFLLIVNLASNDRTHVSGENPAYFSSKETENAKNTLENTPKETLFATFGENKFDYNSDAKLAVENKCDFPVYVCVFNYKKEFVRLVTLKALSSSQLLHLPKDKLLLTYCVKNTLHSKSDQEPELFFKSLEFKYAESINPLTLVPQSSKGFIKISREEFFEYSK